MLKDKENESYKKKAPLTEEAKNINHIMINLLEEFKKLRKDILSISSGRKYESELEETAITFPEKEEMEKEVFQYLNSKAIEFELAGEAIILNKRDAKKIIADLSGVPIKEKQVMHSSELDYEELGRSREKYQK